MDIKTLIEKYKVVFDSMEDETGVNNVEELDENLLDKKPNIDQAIYDEIKQKQPEVAEVNDRLATKLLKQFESLHEVSKETAENTNIKREVNNVIAAAKAKNGTEEEKEEAKIAKEKLEKNTKLLKRWKKSKGIEEAFKGEDFYHYSTYNKCKDEKVIKELLKTIRDDIKDAKEDDNKELVSELKQDLAKAKSLLQTVKDLKKNEKLNEAIKEITRDEWNRTPDDYKMIRDGKKYIMYLDPESHATVLGPCKIIDEAKKVEISKVEETVLNAIKKYFNDDPDLLEYINVEGRKQDDRLVIEVRAELDYDGMTNLAEKLDKIIRKFDKEAYFEQVEPGVMEAFLNVKIDEAIKERVVAKFDEGKHEIVKCSNGYFNRYNIKDGKARCITKCVEALPTALTALKKRFPNAEEMK